MRLWATAHKMIQRLCIILGGLSATIAQPHTNDLSHNSNKFYAIYSLNNTATNLLYQFDSGTVYKQNAQGISTMHAHAHIIQNKLPHQGTVLGYIRKNEKGGTSQDYYVYVETRKTKKAS